MGWLPALLVVPSAVMTGVVVTVPEDELAAMREQQPLDAGTTWVYQVFDHGEPSGTRTSQVVGSASLLGRGDDLALIPVAEVRRAYTDYPGSGPRTMTAYLAVEGRTMLQYAQEEGGTWYDLEPPAPAYQLPSEAGRSWDYQGAIGTTDLSFETELVDVEDVEVSGRTFTECTHAVTTVPLDLEDAPGAEEVIDEWTCPGYGTVKVRDRVEATDLDITEELIAFHGVDADWVADGSTADTVTDTGTVTSTGTGAETESARGSTEGFDRARSYAVPDGVLGRTLAWTDLRTERGLLAPVSDGETMVLAERNGAVSLRTTGTGEMRWRVQLRGPLLATPVLAGDVVVVADSLKRVWALSTQDGTARWVHEMPDVASASPVVAQDHVVVPSDDGTVAALGVADGEVRWSHRLEGAARTSPAFDGTHLLFGDLAGSLTALDPEDGTVAWSDSFDSGLVQGPVATENGILVQDGSGVVHAYAEDGAILWQTRGRGLGGAPMAAGNEVVVTTDAGEAVAAYATDDGRRLWRRPLVTISSPPVVIGSEVLLVTRQGEVHVFGLTDGRRVDRWTLPRPTEGGEFFVDVSMALVDDAVVITAPMGAGLTNTVLYAYPVTTEAPTAPVPRLHSRPVPGTPLEPPLLVGDDLVIPLVDELVKVGPDGSTSRLLRSPDGFQTGAAVADGIVVARSNDQLQGRRLADGGLLWKAPAGTAGAGATPVIDRSTVFVGGEGRGLSAIDLRSGEVRWTAPIPTQAFVPSPEALPDGDVVYGGGGLARYAGATGRLEWQDPDLHMVAPPAYADGLVFAAGIPLEGPAAFVAVDAATGRRLWEHQMTDPPFYLAPAAGDGVVVSIDGRVAHAYDARSGEELWSVATSRGLGGAPVIADGHVFLTESGIGRDLDDQAYRVSVHDLRTGRFVTAWEPGAMPISPYPNVGGAPGGPLLVPTSVTLAVLELR